ncbi:MAG: methylmalonyl Co-A mutase-associated GTPase MeaB [Armatimonadetes bacterium]|nr:methylmalonyl Co-A mutase-associated GTPase MeaB [Armatimonadota bacterium]
MPGIAQPSTLNPRLVVKRRRSDSPESIFEQLRNGDRIALARAITLCESTHPVHASHAEVILDLALKHATPSRRFGITGIPGVGKSTLIEALGNEVLADERNKLAILAIDPTSAYSHGSILGDKSRMPTLAVHPRAFIRPSPTGGHLGGVAHQTRESILLCEAAGYNVIFVETVGVGQSEFMVREMVDCFLLLILAGAGDELQGIKRGVMEMANVLAITKCDGDNIIRAKIARQQVLNALHLSADPGRGLPPVILTSAVSKSGIQDLWTELLEFCILDEASGRLSARRTAQAVHWMQDLVREGALERLSRKPGFDALEQNLRASVTTGELTPRSAAQQLLNFATNR